MEEKKLKRRYLIQNILLLSLIVIIACSFLINIFQFEIKNDQLYAEAGTNIEYIINENNIRDYLYISNLTLNNISIDAMDVNTSRSGEYTLRITNHANNKTLKLKLTITDSKDPIVEWYDYIPEVPVGIGVSAEIFVKEARDDAGIDKIYFLTPDKGRELTYTPKEAGLHEVTVVVQDINNRQVSKEVSILAVD